MNVRALALGMIATVFAGGAHALLVVADLEDYTNGGGFFARVTIEDTGTNTVTVTGDIADPINAGLTQGDILGIGFQISDELLLGGLSVTNGDPTGIVTASCFDANDCTLFMGGSGMPGQNLDIVIRLGIAGSAAGFIETLSFDLVGVGLGALNFVDQLIGMRVQSIEGEDRTFAGTSSNLTGSGPTTSVPEPGSLTLLGAGLLGLAFARRRRTA